MSGSGAFWKTITACLSEYFRRTGIFPIMHVKTIKRDIV